MSIETKHSPGVPGKSTNNKAEQLHRDVVIGTLQLEFGSLAPESYGAD
jgi:hypothetical protein